MKYSQQMGSARTEERQQGDAVRKRQGQSDPQKRPQQQGAQPAQQQPAQQSGGDAGSGQMHSTQFTDWASI